MTLQMAMFTPKSEWVPPHELPDIFDAKTIAIDVETKDPNLKTKGPGWPTGDGEVVGYAVAVDGWKGYIPIRHGGGGNIDERIVNNWMKKVCESPAEKIMHNAQYDAGWLRRMGFTVKGRIIDTMVIASLLDENRFSYSLNALAFDYLSKTKSEKNDKRIVDIFNSKFKIKTDHIILAIGQKQEFKTTKSITNIFHAGDYKLGATTLINAIGDAKKTAKEVDNFLMKRDLTNFEYKVEHGVQTSRSLKFNYIPVTDMRLRDQPKRTFKNEVEIGYNKIESKKESSRCYLCHYQYEINDDLCVLCDECLLVRPVNECIKEVSSKSISDNGRVSIKRIEPGKSHGIYHGLLYIDPKVCVRCGECEKACPTGAIKLTKVTKVNASA